MKSKTPTSLKEKVRNQQKRKLKGSFMNGKETQLFKNERKGHDQNHYSPTEQAKKILTDLTENLTYIEKTLGSSTDIIIREFHAGENGQIKFGIIYTEGLTDTDAVQDFVLNTLMVEVRTTNFESQVFHTSDVFKLIKSFTLPVGDIKEITDFQKLFLQLLSGNTILLMDGFSKGLVFGFGGWAERGVEEPSSQTVVRGPKDGFSENIRTNTALIRRRIKDPNLWVETQQIGTKTQTDVSIMYLKDVVNDETVVEVKNRLNRINIDAILESGYIEELIQDGRWSPFPTIFNTERPDAVAGAILEGRIAILVDGTPYVLIVPALFVHFFQSSEDYYQRADIATLIRLLRYLAFFLALLTPSFYIAISTFHQEMLPTPLLISLAAQREGVPFPAIVEAIMMEVTFEILREAGVRMPRAVGSAISIVGALVVGQAAVEAGIVSATMVIVVSLTAISSFVFPAFNMAITIRMMRFLFMMLAATFGLYGIVLGLILLVLHLNSLRSFGIPYLTPFSPFILQDQKDNMLRFQHWKLVTRPRLISQKNVQRNETPPPKQSE